MSEGLMHNLIEIGSIVTLPVALFGMAYAITVIRGMDRYIRTHLPDSDTHRRAA